MTEKIQRLIKYCQGIYHKEDGVLLYKKYLKDIKTITPEELIIVEHEQLKAGMSSKEMLTFVDKLINVFYESLSSYQTTTNLPDFLRNMIDENKALESILDDFKEDMKDMNQMTSKRTLAFVTALKGYNNHMEKVENILFSYLEKEDEHFNGLQIMWSLHDEIRLLMKVLSKSLETILPKEMMVEIGRLYFLLYGAVQKQNLVLFPVSMNRLTKEQFESMYHESFDYGFSYIETPEKLGRTRIPKMDQLNKVIQTETGHLEIETLISILNVLPIDFTFVDEKDEVAYFNDSKDRIFPRSSSIIGRNVRNCHPPESVHVVEDILKAFKEGEREHAEFWIKMKGMMIYIYYLPIKDGRGNYKGTLEISQEISGLRALDGEKRLLDWK
ncbi:MAG: DUF438 domain-containing protein [Clostridiales bacterium]|nr:DUF438 domain-containing protein [Clostridiales bacterium]